jgi:hypothetical protein
MLIKILRRAKYLAKAGVELEGTPSLKYFLENDTDPKSFIPGSPSYEHFALLDDTDIYVALKLWINSNDQVLSNLSRALINRKLFKIEMSNKPVPATRIQEVTNHVRRRYNIEDDFDLQYFVFHDTTSNSAYTLENKKIKIKTKEGEVIDVIAASDNLNLMALADTVVKHYLCYPKSLGE